MTPLPAALSSSAPLVAWRVDEAKHAATWDSGLGAEKFGGRWNPKGLRVVYASFDPSTTILEAAVHRGFKVLDTQAFMLTSFVVTDPSCVHVVHPSDLPNPAWLHSGLPSAGQQQFGAQQLRRHPVVVWPSVVSKLSWNLAFRPEIAVGLIQRIEQSPLVVDTRLHPPTTTP